MLAVSDSRIGHEAWAEHLALATSAPRVPWSTRGLELS